MDALPDQDPVQAKLDADRAARARAKTQNRKEARLHANDAVRVVINAPHSARVSGKNVAITIKAPDVPAQAAAGSGIPAGYEERTITLKNCDTDEEETGTILFKPDA